MKKRVCVECGRRYFARKHNQRYCGHKCRWAYWRKRREEGHVPVPRQSRVEAKPPLDWDLEMAIHGIGAAITHCETKLKYLREAMAALQGKAS